MAIYFYSSILCLVWKNCFRILKFGSCKSHNIPCIRVNSEIPLLSLVCVLYLALKMFQTSCHLIGDESFTWPLIGWLGIIMHFSSGAVRIFCDFCQQVHAVHCEEGGLAVEIKSWYQARPGRGARASMSALGWRGQQVHTQSLPHSRSSSWCKRKIYQFV